MDSVIIFVLIFVMVIHIEANLIELTVDEDEGPACPNRKALPFSSALMGQLPQNWYVNRLTIMTKLPPTTPPPKENCCHPLTYLADCKGENPIGGIHVSREWQADGGFIKITKAYSDKFQNIAEFWEVQSLDDEDPNHGLVFGAFLRYMTIHTKDKKTRDIASYDFPELILYAAARDYAIVYYQAELEWIHYVDCDTSASWVEISEDAVKNNRVDAINEEIDEYLEANPKIPAMECIPLELPFQV